MSTLLGETVAQPEADVLSAICEKLEIVNLQLAQRKALRKSILHWSLISFCAAIAVLSVALIAANSPYLGWDFSDPEMAVAGTLFHAFEWLFVRLAPIALIAALVGTFLTRKE